MDKLTPQPVEKIPLKQTQEKNLRAYYFITRPINISVKDEGIIRALDFDLDGALAKAAGLNKENFALKYIGNEEIAKLFEFIYQGEGGIITPEVERTIEPIPQVEMSKQQFIYNILLAADEYLPKDKAIELKKLLKHIKADNKNNKS